MNISEFTRQLRAAADELKPLTQALTVGAATWNGVEYIKGVEKTPNPYALAWWSTLIAVAELMEAQETPATPRQINYLDRLLFGGMGSLNDLSFDPKSVGPIASDINVRLEIRRHALFATFKSRN